MLFKLDYERCKSTKLQDSSACSSTLRIICIVWVITCVSHSIVFHSVKVHLSLVPGRICCVMRKGVSDTRQTYLVGVAGLKDVTGHFGLGVVRLAPQQIGKITEVIAVVDEARDELRLVLEYKDWGVIAAGGDAADEGGVEHQLNFSRLHHGAAVASLAPPADLSHQPRQHGQGGPPVQRGPADVSQGEPLVWLRRTALPLTGTLHVNPADFRPRLVDSDVGRNYCVQ